MKFIIVLLALFPLAAAADMEFRQGDDSIRFTEKPCTNEAVRARLAENADLYFEAHVMFQGQEFSACWAPIGNVFHLQYEDGDQGVIPVREVKPVVDV